MTISIKVNSIDSRKRSSLKRAKGVRTWSQGHSHIDMKGYNQLKYWQRASHFRISHENLYIICVREVLLFVELPMWRHHYVIENGRNLQCLRIFSHFSKSDKNLDHFLKKYTWISKMFMKGQRYRPLYQQNIHQNKIWLNNFTIHFHMY